jgi:hypothetical protein
MMNWASSVPAWAKASWRGVLGGRGGGEEGMGGGGRGSSGVVVKACFQSPEARHARMSASEVRKVLRSMRLAARTH